MKKHLYLIVIFVSLFSCKKEDLISIINKNTEPFSTVYINDEFEVYLSEDSTFSVRIEGYEKTMKKVEITVENGTLTIDNNRKIKFFTPTKNKLKVFIKSKPLSILYANEGCHIKTSTPITGNEFGLVLQGKQNQATLDLDCNIFYYWNNFPCGGRVELSGKTNVLKVWNHAIMTFDSKNLIAKKALIDNFAKVDCQIKATENLTYSIYGKGNIHLYGSPTEIVKNEITSTGELIVH